MNRNIAELIVSIALLLFCHQAIAKKEPLAYPIAAKIRIVIDDNIRGPSMTAADGSVLSNNFGIIGGLIGSAVENAQLSKGQQRAKEVMAVLSAYPLNRKFQDAVIPVLHHEGISPNPEFFVLNPENRKSYVENMPEPGNPAYLMEMVPFLSLSHTGDVIILSTSIFIYRRELKKNGKEKMRWPAELREYKFRYSIPMKKYKSEDIEAATSRWLRDGEQDLTGKLDFAVTELAEMIKFDFTRSGRALWKTPPQKNIVEFDGLKYPGFEVKRTDKFVVVSTGDVYPWAVSANYVIKD